ncbi:hypothetical protein C8F04DRAFT_1322501, partial [Mycena alexandri]
LLMPYADVYNYALLDGRRIIPTDRSIQNTAGSSIVQVRFGDEACAGEVRAVLVHKQPNVPESGSTVLLMVEWMIESADTPLDNNEFIWSKFPELGVNTWEYQRYEDPRGNGAHPTVIALSDVHCQKSRGTLDHTNPHLWMTTTMDR